MSKAGETQQSRPAACHVDEGAGAAAAVRPRTQIPRDEIYVDNVPVLTSNRLLALLRSQPARMDDIGVMVLAGARPPAA